MISHNRHSVPLHLQIVEVASYIAKLQGDENENPAYVSDISSKLEADKKDEVLNQIATDSPILLTAPVKGMYRTFVCFQMNHCYRYRLVLLIPWILQLKQKDL
jgi:hypothetical protein